MVFSLKLLEKRSLFEGCFAIICILKAVLEQEAI